MWIPFTPVWCLTLIRRWLQNNLFGQQTELAAKTSGKFRWRLHVTTRPRASITSFALTDVFPLMGATSELWMKVCGNEAKSASRCEWLLTSENVSVSGERPRRPSLSRGYGWGWGWGWRWFHQIWRHTPNKGWILWACQTEIAGSAPVGLCARTCCPNWLAR